MQKPRFRFRVVYTQSLTLSTEASMGSSPPEAGCSSMMVWASEAPILALHSYWVHVLHTESGSDSLDMRAFHWVFTSLMTLWANARSLGRPSKANLFAGLPKIKHVVYIIHVGLHHQHCIPRLNRLYKMKPWSLWSTSGFIDPMNESMKRQMTKSSWK